MQQFFAQEICSSLSKALSSCLYKCPSNNMKRKESHQSRYQICIFLVSACFSFYQLEEVNTRESQEGVRNGLSSHGEWCLDYASIGDCLPPLSLPSFLMHRI